MATDLIRGLVRAEEAARLRARYTTGAKAPSVTFCYVRRRTRDSRILAVLVTLVMGGCNEGAQLSLSEWYQLRGVQDVEAPNSELSEWSRPSVEEPPQGGSDEIGLSSLFRGDKQEMLDLVNVELTDAIRAELRACHHVKWLRLPASVCASDLHWISQMKQLRGLSLNGTNLHGADLRSLESLDSLQWLNLYGARMDEAEIATLPHLSRLENLNLGGTALTDNGIHHLISLELPSLAALCLYDARITDDGVEQLCAHYQLRYLSLYSASNVTTRSVDAIGRMKSLRLLGVGLSGISPDGTLNPDVKRLQRLLPRCVVDYGG